LDAAGARRSCGVVGMSPGKLSLGGNTGAALGGFPASRKPWTGAHDVGDDVLRPGCGGR